MVWAGDSPDDVAGWYDVTRDDVLLCCWFYVDQGQLHPHRSLRKRRWRAWHYRALRVLGGWLKDAELCDPDDWEGTSVSDALGFTVPSEAA
jgi:hypothetical protein